MPGIHPLMGFCLRMLANRSMLLLVSIIMNVWLLTVFLHPEDSSRAGSSESVHLTDLETVIVSKEYEIQILRKKLRKDNPRLYQPNLPIIYVITPTFYRPVQKAELTRLSNTFRLVPNLHWIVVEDSPDKTPLVTNFLHSTGLNFTQLVSITPLKYKLQKNESHDRKHRGVFQRITGLEWLRRTRHHNADQGVVYLADDDNTYSTQLFEEVVDWRAWWHRKERKFATDMAGFAINLRVILEKSDVIFSMKAPEGHQETCFLEALDIELSDLEPKAEMCTKVLVWHTRTVNPDLSNEKNLVKIGLVKRGDTVEV